MRPISEWTYEAGVVCLDDPEGGYTVPPTPAIVVANARWNGAQIPYFTRENADKVMAAWNKAANDEDGKMWWDAQRDGYCVSYTDTEEMYAFEGEDIDLDGETLHLYGIGACAFTWDPPAEGDFTCSVGCDLEGHACIYVRQGISYVGAAELESIAENLAELLNSTVATEAK